MHDGRGGGGGGLEKNPDYKVDVNSRNFFFFASRRVNILYQAEANFSTFCESIAEKLQWSKDKIKMCLNLYEKTGIPVPSLSAHYSS